LVVAECHVWTAGRTKKGYGRFWDGKRVVDAHTYAYRAAGLVIPDGLVLDHAVCNNKLCVRADHLEPVTRGENVRRHFRLQTHCKHGHSLEDALIHHGRRECRECNRLRGGTAAPTRLRPVRNRKIAA
jgi:hypothetical protein